LLVAVHAEFEVTAKLVLPAAAVTFWFGGVTVKVGATPACVTVTITGGMPDTVTVMFATRDEGKVFCV
jgi:hypothetical protein